MQPIYNQKEVKNIEELLDDISNMRLYRYLQSLEKLDLRIIFLLFSGYSVAEISNIVGLNVNAIYYRIRKIKKKISIFLKNEASNGIYSEE